MDSWLLVGLDGWIGAVLGSLVSIAVAVFVLRRTLRHEREHFLRQLEHERALALEQQRLEAFAHFCTELFEFGRKFATVQEPRVDDVGWPTLTAFDRWSLFMPTEADEFRGVVNRGIATIKEAAGRAVAEAASPTARRRLFAVHDGLSDTAWLAREGRRWHLEVDTRRKIEEEGIARFPKRTTIDDQTGEAKTV